MDGFEVGYIQLVRKINPIHALTPKSSSSQLLSVPSKLLVYIKQNNLNAVKCNCRNDKIQCVLLGR